MFGNITSIRLMRGFTKNRLSQMCGLNRNYISELERGSIKNPSIPVLKNISDVLNVSVDVLVSTDNFSAAIAKDAIFSVLYERLNSEDKKKTIEYMKKISTSGRK